MNGRIKKGVTFNITHELAAHAPAEVVRRLAAEKAGDLLTEMLLDPEADPFSGLQLHADYHEEPFYDAVSVRIALTCDRTPVQYVPIGSPMQKGLPAYE